MPAPLARFTLPSRYRLEGGIAAGGMAAVYAAHDELLDRPVAVKVLAEHLNSDDTARRRFQREARAAAGLSSHPAVVTIFDVGEHEGRSFIVMERRTGGTVGDALREGGRIEPQRALGWLRGVAGALDAAHERGIVHRDIKPGNLLLDENDRVAVADFGIAWVGHETEQMTQTGQVLGTAAYISPEQAVGEPATPASDRYALAAVAFELLTGRRPFPGDNFAAQARAHVEDPPPPATSLVPELPRTVDPVLARGLAKDPSERWPSATEFVDALGRALAGAPPTAPTRPLAGALPRRDRRGPAGVIAAVALLLVVAVIALVAALSSGGDGERATRDAERTPAAENRREREPKKTPTAEATAQQTATAVPAGNPDTLNSQGFELFERGDYEAALPYFQKAVEACGDSQSMTCAYATYNLGASLHRSGRSAEAIPVLQRRLTIWPNDQPDVVAAELAAACEAAGVECEGVDDGKGRGRGRGKGNGKDD